MSEETIAMVVISMKMDAFETVLSSKQREEYRKILQLKKGNFKKVWGKYLTEEKLEETLLGFDI